MRRAALIIGLATAAVAAASPGAVGAGKSVSATSDPNLFKPDSVTVDVGDTVTWHSDGGTPHNVHFRNGTKLGGDPLTHSPAATSWTDDFTFNKAGTFDYWCDEHSDGTFGMVGKVVVVDPNAPPRITKLSAKPASFCTNKSVTCHKRGTKIKLTLSKPARVSGQIRPKDGSKPFKTIFSGVAKPAGKSSIDYSGKGLKPRKYVLRVRAKDSAGHVSPWVKTTVRVVKNG